MKWVFDELHYLVGFLLDHTIVVTNLIWKFEANEIYSTNDYLNTYLQVTKS